MSDTKILLGSGLLIFWLCFGFIMMYLLPSSSIDFINQYQNKVINTEMNVYNAKDTIFDTFNLFFKSLTLSVPNIPVFLKIFVNTIQILSLILIVFCFLDLISDIFGNIVKLIGMV